MDVPPIQEYSREEIKQSRKTGLKLFHRRAIDITDSCRAVEKQQSRKTGLKPKLPWPSAKCTVTWVIPKPRRNKTIPQDGIRPLKRLHVLTLKRSNGLNDLARRDRETTASFPKENAARSPHSHGKIYTTPQDGIGS